jgi:hypothetical protein
MPKKASPTKTTNPLPFLDLDPHRFEDLVRNLVYEFRKWRSIEATGRAGGDDGFDVRGWEETSEISNVDEENDEPGTHPMEGNLWKIQCKREKQLGPAKVRAIVDESVDKKDPPYGYVLVAPTTFSKRSYDVFRNELRAKGVTEFYLWGKAELEDMLFLPKNDSILFAFFGISLITRQRSRTAEIKFSINNKNKLLRILSDGDPRREVHKPILARDFKDRHYPWETEYKDFDRLPRWKQYTAIAFHPLGLIVEVAKHFATVNIKAKEWDFVDAVNLLNTQSDDEEIRKDHFEKEDKIRDVWRYLPRANQAYLIVNGLMFFEDILAIDDKGDSIFAVPHIFVDFRPRYGPFRWLLHSLQIGQESIHLSDEYKRVKSFPTFSPPKGKIYRDCVVEFNSGSARRFLSEYSIKAIFDVSGKYAFLNQRDVVRVAKDESVNEEEKFIEITHKYEISSGDYLSEHPEQRNHIENQIRRKLSDTDELTVLEFETIYSWELENSLDRCKPGRKLSVLLPPKVCTSRLSE